MQKRIIQAGLTGMNQDVINPKVNSQYAYEIKNFRINSTGHSNGIELTTEKGTCAVTMLYNNVSYQDLGQVEQQMDGSKSDTFTYTIIGHCVLNQYLTIFTHGISTTDETVTNDKIIRLELLPHNTLTYYFKAVLLYEGDLGFDNDHRIECIPCMESVDILKIYWIDGKNYPRVINIVKDGGYTDFGPDEDPFSFYQKISSGSYNTIDVEKSYVGGLFYAGVVQYAFSFYNKNTQETPVIYTTPLNYISHSDRGEAPNKQLGCAFEITVKINPEDKNKFEYVRVYSIYRSSIDATPVVKVIKDIKCDNLQYEQPYYSVTFSDTNEQGYDFDAYRILVNSDHIKPEAIATKDQKMFLANFSSDGNLTSDDSLIDCVEIDWKLTDEREIPYKHSDINGYYNHNNQNQYNSEQFKTFKYGEYYKLGLQFQDSYGNWSSVYPVATSKNSKHPVFKDDKISLPYAQSEGKLKGIINIVKDKGYVKVRPVVSFPTINERKILCLGIINPTVFNITGRYDNTCFSQASWFFRPYPFEAKQDQLIYTFSTPVFIYGETTYNTLQLLQAALLSDAIDAINLDLGSDTHCEEIQYFFDTYPLYDIDQDTSSTTVRLAVDSVPDMSNQGYYRYEITVTIDSDLELSIGGNVEMTRHLFMSFKCDTNDNFLGKQCYKKKSYTTSQIQQELKFEGNAAYKVVDVEENKYILNGAICQFNHYQPLFDSSDIGGEIQGMYFDDSDENIPTGWLRKKVTADLLTNNDMSVYRNYFFVDQQICTINSPELDFNEQLQNVDLSQYKVRIIGYIPFWSNTGGYDVISESPLFKRNKNTGSGYIRGTNLPSGFYNYNWTKYGGFNDVHDFCAGAQQVSSIVTWFDDVTGLVDSILGIGIPNSYIWNQESKEIAYFTYPWHREYLNNYSGGTAIDYTGHNEYEDEYSSKIIKKVLSNVKYADHTVFFNYNNNDSNLPDEIYSENIDTDYIGLFKFENNTNSIMVGNKYPYCGNVDLLLTYTGDFLYNIEYVNNDEPARFTIPGSGYPITVAKDVYPAEYSQESFLTLKKPALMSKEMYYLKYLSLNLYSTSPIMMRYNSSRHIVFKIREDNGTQYILPVKEGSSYKMNDITLSEKLVWEQSQVTLEIVLNEIDVESFTSGQELDENDVIEGYLWLGELYRQDSVPYQDDDWNGYKERIWAPCGRIYDFEDDYENYVKWTEGDTYFQRYDCLKTYPYSNDDYQSVVEIASFMVETHVNLDGRYDENRGLIDNTFVNPTNFNLINPIYSQTNNFFQYNVLDEEDFKTTDFPTRFTWSLNKVNGLDIDEWTRTNTSAFYDVDGDKGPISSLRRFNDLIYAFQDKGISRIKYNENVAINTNNGTPIELANSLSVNGVEYISELVGSQNKWSNISTPNGIFFTDNYTAGLYRLGGGERILTNLTKNTLQRWFESNNTNHDFIDTASYDANMNEVHFMFDDQSLAYNNDFGTLSSFYDYKGWIGNIKNHSFNITGNSVYFLREGLAYNTFYGNIKPYWIEFVANSNIDGYSPSNAIYDNVWYNADVLADTEYGVDNMNYNEIIEYTDDKIPRYPNGDLKRWYETFTKIEAGNDYQYGKFDNSSDTYTLTKNFKFIKKFRTWRVPVPRNQIGTKPVNLHRDRMRNQWLRVKLTNANPSTNKMILRDIYVDSFF